MKNLVFDGQTKGLNHKFPYCGDSTGKSDFGDTKPHLQKCGDTPINFQVSARNVWLIT